MEYDSTFLSTRKENWVKLSELVRALSNKFPKMGEREVKNLAETIMNFVGYGHTLLDNRLEPAERDIFYMLEEEGLATPKKEEITLFDGREWRIYTWHLKVDEIKKVAQDLPSKQPTKRNEKEGLTEFYESLGKEVWARA